MRSMKRPDWSYSSYEGQLLYLFGGHKMPNMHKWGPGVRDVYAMHYIVGGKGIYETNNEVFRLKAGDSFMIFPHNEVYYYPDRQEPWEYVWVEFKGEEAEQLLAMIDISADKPVLGEAPSSLQSYFQMEWKADMKPFEKQRFSAQLRLLLSVYMEYYPTTIRTRPADYVETAKAFIHHNFWKPGLSVAEIVGEVNIERSYLFRLFKERTGMSLSEYLTAFRIRRACQLLESSGLSVKSVACSVGYKDQLYFSRVFKKATAYTPTEYMLSHADNRMPDISGERS